MATKTNTKIEEIRTSLFSSDEKKVLKSLEKVKKKGDHTFIEPLFLLATTHENQDIQNEATNLLQSLKISKAEGELFRLMQEEDYYDQRALLLSYLWNSGFFPTDRILVLTNYLLEGDFLTALESLTVIENMESPFDEEQLTEALGLTKTYLLKNPNAETNDLVISLFEVLSRFQKEE